MMLAASLVAMLLPRAVQADVPSGAMYVTTLPSAADIWVDGTYVGRAPVLVDALSPGHHALTITKTGWIVRDIDVAVAAGTVAMSSTKLEPEQAGRHDGSGSLVVRAPAGVPVTVDGIALRPPAKPMVLPAGPHRISLQTRRGSSTRVVTILPDTMTEAVVQEPADESRSPVVAAAEEYLPADDVSIEGKKVVVRYGGHVVVGHLGDNRVRVDGATVDYDATPQTIGGKLFLPLALLEKLTRQAASER